MLNVISLAVVGGVWGYVAAEYDVPQAPFLIALGLMGLSYWTGLFT